MASDCSVANVDPVKIAQIRARLIDEQIARQLAETFKALSDPTRVRILSALADGELCVGELAATLEMSISAISHQLSLLRKLRVVKARREGRHVFYSLDDEHVSEMYRCGLDHALHT